jgi:hypothetical protein
MKLAAGISQRSVQPEHEMALGDRERETPREGVSPQEADDLRLAWRRYCEVIAELE